MTNIRSFRFMASILIGFILVLSTSPAAATSQRPVVVGYLAAFKGPDLSIARADLAAFTHYTLSFANPDAEGRFVNEGRRTCLAGETAANLTAAGLRGAGARVEAGGGRSGRRAGGERQ